MTIDSITTKVKLQETVIQTHNVNPTKKSTICLSTGSGKTFLSMKICTQRIEEGKVCGFMSKQKLHIETAMKELSYFTNKTIDFFCTKSRNKYIKYYDFVIIDECHLETKNIVDFLRELININSDIEIICLTGTPNFRDPNFKDLIKICPIIYRQTHQESVDDEITNDVMIYIVGTELSKDKTIPVEYTKEGVRYKFFTSEYSNYIYAANKYLADKSKITILKKVLNNIPTKEIETIDLIKKLNISSSNKAIIYAGSVNQAESINNKLIKLGYKTVLYHGKLKQSLKKELFNQFNSEIDIIINVDSIKESVSIKNLKYGIICAIDSTSSGFEQIYGRFKRLLIKDQGHLFCIIANQTIENIWFKNATTNLKEKILDEYNF